MEDLALQVTILRLSAALYILTAALEKSKNGRITLVLALPLLAVSAVIHHSMNGTSGFLFFLSGVSVAIILTLIPYMHNRITPNEFVISCTIGGILGPAGYSVSFIIAVSLLAVQRLLKADSLPASDFISINGISCGSNSLIKDERSALAEIEARKMLRSDGMSCGEDKRLDIRSGVETGDMSKSEVLPWRAKMALAVIAVLMIGIH